MKICPHCGKLPPTLYPQFVLYLILTLVALGAAFFFRPFLEGPYIGEVVIGVLWAAFVIFCFFGLIFAFVCIALLNDYSNRSYKGKLTKAERLRFIKMKQHIESGRHFYERGNYCTVCGQRKR